MGLWATYKRGLPYLKPIRVIILAFGITGYLIWNIPISGIKIKIMVAVSYYVGCMRMVRSLPYAQVK